VRNFDVKDTDMLVVLLVVNQVFVAMYIFELIFRAKLSYVAVLHHIGSVIIASSAVAISLNWQHQHDATLEFMLCLLWGKLALPRSEPLTPFT
jgi:hypothetical protein